mgnify:CR=1 FL=1
MAGLLDNQVAVITGAGRGIGAATAKLFAEQGAKLVLSDLDPQPMSELADKLKGNGAEVVCEAGDVTNPEFPDALMKKAADAFGKVNILINNAGYTWDGMIHKMTDKQYQAMLDVHNVAPFRMIRAAAPYMRDAAKAEKAGGNTPEPRCIINISSVAGLNGNTGQANYSTAKSGILGLTKTIAKEWGPFGIRCNTVAFGFVETRLTGDAEAGQEIDMAGEKIPLGIPSHMKGMITMLIPLQRPGTPEEAAGAIFLLATPYASYITGATLEATGGLKT